ncbi:protein SMG7-like [Tripterygium wilfordii]|uniref:Protein SMG7-like n=1 Tax=Tripterygium wilfordii TaxID=458696 RepID=A0A7J7DV92_TRIWF|nr:protein SMG7-like [Tripterygium wilfordii]XP_038691922.1 protein SMG7-like [Tripterygium wilfordii]XP_038691930.1 protein SMG7-like [Tripterygium wilfordii]XP_038691936.1 protein SMG7-like [Tripterygium wilfordii]KAF5750285.1 protein SMG7-like [Tripterygium wilfordii]
MTTKMDNSADLSSRERAQRLYNKNVELESKRRRSAQSKIPSDPNAWQQMRENYEAIILEDHAFAEQHEIEYVLWQLHYRRIEELRGHFNAALAPTGSATSQGGKVSARPERVAKIRSQFKNFLSEATGFYHDLMLKIRSKYGLPLGYFSDGPETQIVLSKDGNKSAETKKGLVSCHRCLIYLGDLSRYKGLYGEGDSKTRDFAAASTYYMQACSLWPSSGNPHHQLAIVASYSGDELLAIYRYFRSLAVDNPFSTARDNLIVAFEKNRQSFSQLVGDANGTSVKSAPMQMNVKERGKVGTTTLNDSKMEASSVKQNSSCTPEDFKAFSIRFVRLNGILFTRTSLETFGEVFSMVRGDLIELLSSGPEENYKFGSGAADVGVLIVRLIAIVIFTVHNVNREVENQSYADILQRSVLLKNAFTFVFEFTGLIVKRCLQLHDASGSSLLPGVLIFMDWLACHPDFAAGSEVDEKQAAARSFFWNNCIILMNKLLSNTAISIEEDKDETCFFNMSRYDESETSNRLALWEDFELRGFVPLAPAQSILDFSRKQSLGSDGSGKAKRARLQRIISAGKALISVVRVGQQSMYFDSRGKKFSVGVEPEIADYELIDSFEAPVSNGLAEEHSGKQKVGLGLLQSKSQLHMDGEEEDEVIVFKPTVSDKQADCVGLLHSEIHGSSSNASQSDIGSSVGTISAPHNGSFMMNAFDTNGWPTASLSTIPLPLKPIQPSTSKWQRESEVSVANGLNNLNLLENGLVVKHRLQEYVGVMQPAIDSLPLPLSMDLISRHAFSGQVSDSIIPSKLDSVMPSEQSFDGLHVKSSSALPVVARKNPVGRPARRVGPPPGFSHVPPKPVNESLSGIVDGNMRMDDYSWLDGYQLPSSTKGMGFTNTTNHTAQSYLHANVTNSMGSSFPFPGKQVPTMQPQMENHRIQQEYRVPDHLKLYHELQQQQLGKPMQQPMPLPEQFKGVPPREGRFFV